jgi:hypothetical protein
MTSCILVDGYQLFGRDHRWKTSLIHRQKYPCYAREAVAVPMNTTIAWKSGQLL